MEARHQREPGQGVSLCRDAHRAVRVSVLEAAAGHRHRGQMCMHTTMMCIIRHFEVPNLNPGPRAIALRQAARASPTQVP